MRLAGRSVVANKSGKYMNFKVNRSGETKGKVGSSSQISVNYGISM